MSYQDPDLLSDESALTEQLLDLWATLIPDWEPHDGQIEPPLAEGFAVIAAATNALLKDTARQDYADWGATVLGIVRRAASSASTTTTWHLSDTDGHTVPAGAQVVATTPTGDTAAFITLVDVVAAVGVQDVPGVPIVATEPGEAGNLAAGVADLQDPYSFVESVTLDAPASGGANVEELNDYLDKVVDRAQRQRGIPITVADYAAFALDVPGVERAVAINLLDPAAPGVESPGHITLVPIDANGLAVAPSIAGALVDYLSGDDQRPMQVVVHTTAPTYTTVNVAFAATVETGADPDAVIAAAEDAVTTYLAPATAGLIEDAPGRWRLLYTIFLYEVAEVIQNTPGVDLLETLTLNGDREDVALAGVAPLPQAGTVDGTALT